MLFFAATSWAQQVTEPRANLKFDVDTADFGTVAEGDSFVYEFWFTNIGDADLIIKQAWPACGCTHPSYTKGPIKPGERGFIRVAFHSKGFGGHDLIKEVIIINNGDERYARFKVKVVNMEFKKDLETYKKSQNDSSSLKKEKLHRRKRKNK
ncbi:MAG: DUF1573 domain-containing protein [Bacteroidia bacterium]|nr:DUF1573 domain-containing protein [Bacteroidia bacterium]